MAVSFDALITVDELQEATFGSYSIDLANNYNAAVSRKIENVSALIEQYLDRKLIVSKHTVFPYWTERDNDDYQFAYVVKEYPIVEIVTSDVNKIDDLRIGANNKIDEVEYYAGYKREDQTLSDLQAEFSGLSNTPKNLHPAIKEVAIALTLYEINRAMNRAYGYGTRTTTNGQMSTEIVKERDNVYEHELSKLKTLRYIV